MGGLGARLWLLPWCLGAGLRACPRGTKEEEKPHGLPLRRRLRGRPRGESHAGRDEKGSGDREGPDHARSPCGGSHIKGQIIPSSRLTLVIGTPQHLPGIPAVFQHP